MPKGYPLLFPAVAATAGAAAAFTAIPAREWRLCLAGALILVLLLLLGTAAGQARRALLLLGGSAAAFLAGLGSGSSRVERSASFRFFPAGKQTLLLRIEELDGTALEPCGAVMSLLAVSGTPPEGRPLVWGFAPAGSHPGDVLEGPGRIVPLHKDRYWDRKLAASGIGAKVRLRTLRQVPGGPSPRRLLHRLRHWLAGRFEGKAEGGLFRGLMLGDTRAVEQDRYDRAREGGTVHVLVVSGLHIGIAGAIAMWLGRALGLGIAWRNLAAVAATLLYSLLAGFGTSAFRAWVMFSLLASAPIFRREYDTVNSLSAAVLLIVLLRPEDVVSRGFGLSLGAIAGILLALEALALWKREGTGPLWKKRLEDALGISLGAWMGVAPLSAKYFGMVNALGPLLSLVSVPVLGLFIVTGWVVIAGEVLGEVLPGGRAVKALLGAGSPFYWLASGLGWLQDSLLDAGGLARFGLFTTKGPPATWLIAFYTLAVAGIVYLREQRHLRKQLGEAAVLPPWRKATVRWGFLPALAALVMVWPLLGEALYRPEPGLYFFSGDGEALAVVGRDDILVLSSGGMRETDQRLRRTLRRPYRFLRVSRGLEVRAGDINMKVSPSGRVVWLYFQGKRLAWTIRYKRSVREALGPAPDMVVHTGRLPQGPQAETIGATRVIYVSRLGGYFQLKAPAYTLTGP